MIADIELESPSVTGPPIDAAAKMHQSILTNFGKEAGNPTTDIRFEIGVVGNVELINQTDREYPLSLFRLIQSLSREGTG